MGRASKMGILIVLLCSNISRGADPLMLTGGRIEAIDRARVASDQMGVIASDIPWEGTLVQADQVVAQLMDDVPRAALQATEVMAASDTDIRAAANEAQTARVEWDRAQTANNRILGAVPELEVRRLELAYRQALLKKEQAENQLELNRRKRDEAAALLRSFQVHSPFRGTVTQAFRHRGEAVRQGDPVLELISIDRVRISLEVDLAVLPQLKEGMKVSVVPERAQSDGATNSNESLPGTITYISPEAVLTARKVRVHVLVDKNTNHRLVPGLNATVAVDSNRDTPSS